MEENMKVKIEGNVCTVIREAGDPKCYGVVNAVGESKLLYHVKKELNKQGYDLIKKCMHKDGHMVDDLQQYLRARKDTGNPAMDISIHNDNWSVEGADVPFMKDGYVNLTVTRNIFMKL